MGPQDEHGEVATEVEAPVNGPDDDTEADDGLTGEHLPVAIAVETSRPLDHGVVAKLAAGAAPGAVIEQAANAIRVLCPNRGVAVWYRNEDGTTHVQAAGIGAHLVMIAGDADSPFWDRARREESPNYRITFHAHPEDIAPTSVWCIPVGAGPVVGDLMLVAVAADDGNPIEDDARKALEHITRLIGVSLDRKRLVDRLANAADRPDGPNPTVAMGIAPTRGAADEPRETVVLHVRLAEIKDIEHVQGHRAAEALTMEVGKRLSATVRPGDTIARVNSTDFVLRCYRVAAIQAESIVARVLNDLWTPVVTRWEETRLRPRIGMTRSAEPTPLSQMMQEAEGAMREADRVGRDWAWFGDEFEHKPPELGPSPGNSGFGAGPPGSAGALNALAEVAAPGAGDEQGELAEAAQSEPGLRSDSESGSPDQPAG